MSELNLLSKSTKHLMPAFVFSASVLLSVMAFSVSVHAQAQLSLADILIGLRSNKVTLVERNRILAGAVDERGITFSLTPEIEKELESTGAGSDLIGAIKRRSVIVKTTTVIEPKLPLKQPEPEKIEPAVPVLDFAFYKKSADENFRNGEFEKALENYGKAIELDSGNSSIYLNRALIFVKNKDYQSALRDYDRVIELDPTEIIAYSNRANVYEKNGDQLKAIDDYKKILEIDPKNISAINHLKRIEDERARAAEKQTAQTASPVNSPESADKSQNEPAPVGVKTEKAIPEFVELGQLGPLQAIELASPIYSQIAKNLNLTGQVKVEVEFDEKGEVKGAKAADGHRLLRESAEQAARRSRFKPVLIDGQPVKAKGYIVYSFLR